MPFTNGNNKLLQTQKNYPNPICRDLGHGRHDDRASNPMKTIFELLAHMLHLSKNVKSSMVWQVP